jgi:hypothetical protein
MNRFSGANVHTITISADQVGHRDDKPASATKDPVIGMYASTARRSSGVSQPARRHQVQGAVGPGLADGQSARQRLIITTPAKDPGTPRSRRTKRASRPTRTLSSPRHCSSSSACPSAHRRSRPIAPT